MRSSIFFGYVRQEEVGKCVWQRSQFRECWGNLEQKKKKKQQPWSIESADDCWLVTMLFSILVKQ